MIDFKINRRTKDLVIPPEPIEGADRVAQSIEIRLRTFLGDWFLDTTHGVPYFEDILKKVANLALIESILRAQILDVRGVRAIASFEMQIDPRLRICTVNYSAESNEGLVRGSLNINV